MTHQPPTTPDEYEAAVPTQAQHLFKELRAVARAAFQDAEEVISYGVPSYKLDKGRAIMFVSGWKDHLAVYPVPSDPELEAELSPYRTGKGTISFALDKPLPTALITKVAQALRAEYKARKDA